MTESIEKQYQDRLIKQLGDLQKESTRIETILSAMGVTIALPQKPIGYIIPNGKAPVAVAKNGALTSYSKPAKKPRKKRGYGSTKGPYDFSQMGKILAFIQDRFDKTSSSVPSSMILTQFAKAGSEKEGLRVLGALRRMELAGYITRSTGQGRWTRLATWLPRRKVRKTSSSEFQGFQGAQSLVDDYIAKHPDSTALDVAQGVGIPVGVVHSRIINSIAQGRMIRRKDLAIKRGEGGGRYRYTMTPKGDRKTQ